MASWPFTGHSGAQSPSDPSWELRAPSCLLLSRTSCPISLPTPCSLQVGCGETWPWPSMGSRLPDLGPLDTPLLYSLVQRTFLSPCNR